METEIPEDEKIKNPRRSRRGGAPRDLLFKTQITKMRGRWASDQSAARHERGGRVSVEISR
jgi:hypothetical protein